MSPLSAKHFQLANPSFFGIRNFLCTIKLYLYEANTGVIHKGPYLTAIHSQTEQNITHINVLPRLECYPFSFLHIFPPNLWGKTHKQVLNPQFFSFKPGPLPTIEVYETWTLSYNMCLRVLPVHIFQVWIIIFMMLLLCTALWDSCEKVLHE